MEYINHIETNNIRGLVIDENNNILVSNIDALYIYNIKGDVIKSWPLNYLDHKETRKIAINKNEIYIIDTFNDLVFVFSYQGKIIRTLSYCRSCKFSKLSGIAIYKNIVFISDVKNTRIQAFTNQGKFIFEYKNINLKEYTNILIADDYIYTSSCNS